MLCVKQHFGHNKNTAFFNYINQYSKRTPFSETQEQLDGTTRYFWVTMLSCESSIKSSTTLNGYCHPRISHHLKILSRSD